VPVTLIASVTLLADTVAVATVPVLLVTPQPLTKTVEVLPEYWNA